MGFVCGDVYVGVIVNGIRKNGVLFSPRYQGRSVCWSDMQRSFRRSLWIQQNGQKFQVGILTYNSLESIALCFIVQ